MYFYSFANFGYEGALVNVEADVRNGIPALDIVGISDGYVNAVKERVKVAIANSDMNLPIGRILISLDPVDLKKEGSNFDLAIASAILMNGNESSKAVFVMGELELNGNVRSCRGVVAALQNVKKAGIDTAIVPKGCGYSIDGVKVIEVESLKECIDMLNEVSENSLKKVNKTVEVKFGEYDYGFSDIRGHSKEIRAIQIAVAGKHNILLSGAQGCGKTMLLQRIPSITPLLTDEEKSVNDRIYSLAGFDKFKVERPFRMPHQTATIEGICGGGIDCRPGEISLANNGTLFLDEAAEFRTSVLQMFRVPLESDNITLSRAGRSTTFPAKFNLVMAANPCPCGNFGSNDRICLCSARSINQYWEKFSNPLLDRIEIKIKSETDKNDNFVYTDDILKFGIKRAWETQYKRGVFNGEMKLSDIAKHCEMTEPASKFMSKNAEKLNARERHNVLVVARTIADIDGNDIITSDNIEEAYKLVINNTVPIQM